MLRLAGRAGVAAGVLACGAAEVPDKPVAGTAGAPASAAADLERAPAAADSERVTQAEQALSAWLDASREGGATSRDLARADSLAACGDGGGTYFPSMLLADYQLRPSAMRGDTVVARAVVITVAEQDIDRRADGFIARERVRRDVLEWDLVPLAASQQEPGWAICNGLRFGYRGADSLTTWRPEGSSWQSARRLADSVRATRPMASAAIRQRTS
ncbi:hypothetical protein [Gemmatimonas groenlandica]|uniref:Uncharacterized protein n=1 Tax=Gemmatimonas groenlandica TaxID=2732249 RepID=A0A6M4IW06_9BACT|nr:hypothetical protein [Gemmatimonas groenlandica]QJR37052.1 hypothetical protein HKW67_16770 [Gemmatimonas groenlandica]